MEPKLEFIILCENAFINEADKKLSIINIFDGISTHGFPAVHPRMSVVVKLTMNEGRHKEYMELRKGEQTIAKTTLVEFNTGESKKHQIIHNFENLIFPDVGEYVFELFVDNKSVGSAPMELKRI